MKIQRWLLIGGLSLAGLISTLIILPYSHKLTVSIAILCSLSGVISLVILVKNRNLFRNSDFKWDAHNFKTTMVTGVAFVALTLVLSFLLEFVLFWAYLIIPSPFYVHHEDVAYYQSNEYHDFRWGKQASEYLPSYDTLADANSIEFVYDDGLYMETLYLQTDTKFILNVHYDADLYLMKKQQAIQGGTSFSDDVYPDAWLLGKEKLPFGNHLYYVIICSDDQNKLTYFVTIQDRDDYTSFYELPISFGA
jgi:hypothetical protein